MWMPWIHRSFKHGILDQPGGHRRLGGGNTGEATATHDNPPCVDNDTAYQIEEDKPNVTCHEDPQPSEKYVLFNKLWVMSSGVLPFQVFCWKFIASSFSSHWLWILIQVFCKTIICSHICSWTKSAYFCLWSSKSQVQDASHACQIDLGILHCPLTCGYCSPFEYESLKRFAKPQLTLLPSVIYQTRLKEAECHGFAAVVQTQNLGEWTFWASESFPMQLNILNDSLKNSLNMSNSGTLEIELRNYNPVLTLLPALDGKKKGNLLKCIDREAKQTSEYALYLDCPEHTPSHRCVDGQVGIGHKQSFHGESVYAEMLIESEKVLTSMEKAPRWLQRCTVMQFQPVVFFVGILPWKHHPNWMMFCDVLLNSGRLDWHPNR